jgi:RHS repeat-associated protein
VTLNDELSPGNIEGPVTEHGIRSYELTNHLGNVPKTFAETTEQYTDNQGGTYTAPKILSHQDYTAFGLEWHRSPDKASEQKYRYGFNGKEQDTEGEWGDLTHYDYGFRIYNPGIARFLSIDPKVNELPHSSGYVMASNAPISRIDPDGQWDVVVHVYTMVRCDLIA